MASYGPAPILLKDSTPALIRSAQPSDAAAMLVLRRDEVLDHDYGVVQPDEIDDDTGAIATWIRTAADDPNSLLLLAQTTTAPSQFIGSLHFGGHPQRRIAHHGMLGMGVAPAWRDRGVGRALLEALLEWAGDHPVIERVDLGVYVENARAIHLYESMGFARIAVHPAYFKDDEGRYHDDIYMTCWVKPAPPR